MFELLNVNTMIKNKAWNNSKTSRMKKHGHYKKIHRNIYIYLYLISFEEGFVERVLTHVRARLLPFLLTRSLHVIFSFRHMAFLLPTLYGDRLSPLDPPPISTTSPRPTTMIYFLVSLLLLSWTLNWKIRAIHHHNRFTPRLSSLTKFL